MHLLVYLRRHYSSPLPPTALLRRLEHTVLPRPAGLLWWLGIRRLPCWGKVEPVAHTFWARMPWGRSSGPVIHGHWQVANEAALPLAGTCVQLIIHPSLPELLGGLFMLSFLVLVSLVIATAAISHFVAGFAGLFGLLFSADAWYSIRRAERHFQTALALQKMAA